MRQAAKRTRVERVRTRPAGAKVVPLAPARALATAAKASHEAHAGGRPTCPKCASGFVALEPAFLHCYYCGSMTRIATGSLLAQELFELRSGLRLAS
jgi:hypothetical protein